MVGVPGRSKGCQTCRDRRIKCDLAKPSCLRCVKSKRKCSGYKREATFVYFDADDDKPSATYKPPTKTPSVPAIANANKVAQAIRDDGEPSRSVELVLHDSPGNSAVFREQFMMLFLTAYLPKDNSIGLDYGLSWTQYLPGSLNTSDALKTALTAVSTAMVGRSFGDERLIKKSHQLYGAALSDLRKALLSPTTVSTPDTLGATMALSNYELIQPSGANSIAGWVAHVQGAAQILQNRNYTPDQSPMEKALMIHVKTNCIFDSMSRRRRTFMAEDAWRQRLMGTDVPDLLRNVIVDLPALLEETDIITNGYRDAGTLDVAECFALLTKVEAIDSKLEKWHTHAWNDAQGVLYWPDRIKKEGEEKKLFDSDLVFPNLPAAQMMTSYWSSRALVHDTMEQILCVVQNYQILQYTASAPLNTSETRAIPTSSFSIDTPSFTAPLSIVSCNNNAQKYAGMVCRSVEFCTSIDHRHMGIQAMTQPLWLAQQIFRNRDEVKTAWCLQASKVIATRGLGMIDRVASDFSWQDYADSAGQPRHDPNSAYPKTMRNTG